VLLLPALALAVKTSSATRSNAQWRRCIPPLSAVLERPLALVRKIPSFVAFLPSNRGYVRDGLLRRDTRNDSESSAGPRTDAPSARRIVVTGASSLLTQATFIRERCYRDEPSNSPSPRIAPYLIRTARVERRASIRWSPRATVISLRRRRLASVSASRAAFASSAAEKDRRQAARSHGSAAPRPTLHVPGSG
jgi:hypothetical protein